MTRPVVYAPGNRRDGSDFQPIAQALRQRGYTDADLWPITFSQRTPTHPEMAAQLETSVDAIQQRTGAEQVDVIGHSLGVTGLRWWMALEDRYEDIANAVCLAGANHGHAISTWATTLGLTAGRYRVAPFLRDDYETIEDHPLAQLNRQETPGPTNWYTIRGTQDALFPIHDDSPRLCGADANAVLETDHDGVRTTDAAHELICGWLAD